VYQTRNDKDEQELQSNGAVQLADEKKGGRIGWTRYEDAVITQSVEELGNRWYQIAERLPGRTDHAIRNRWHRLLAMRNDAQAEMSHQKESLGSLGFSPFGGVMQDESVSEAFAHAAGPETSSVF